MKKFEDLVFEEQGRLSFVNKRAVMKFDNGYAVSVVIGEHTYGGSKGLYELAVLLNDDLCYTTPVTDDVCGCCEESDITAYMEQVQKLPMAGGDMRMRPYEAALRRGRHVSTN